jgi:hypothetical protein
MAASKEFLELCLKLNAAGLEVAFIPGQIVARGFADLGYEEFSVAPGRRLFSLFTGNGSTIADGEERHFFLVLNVDQIIAELVNRGVLIQEVVFVEQRHWRVTIEDLQKIQHQALSAKLNVALGQVLLSLLESRNVSS